MWFYSSVIWLNWRSTRLHSCGHSWKLHRSGQTFSAACSVQGHGWTQSNHDWLWKGASVHARLVAVVSHRALRDKQTFTPTLMHSDHLSFAMKRTLTFWGLGGRQMLSRKLHAMIWSFWLWGRFGIHASAYWLCQMFLYFFQWFDHFLLFWFILLQVDHTLLSLWTMSIFSPPKLCSVS